MAARVVQQHLMMTTQGDSGLRSGAIGWSAEDPNRFVAGGGHDRIGLSPGFKGRYSYSTPLAALADGWRLLAPPETLPSDDHPRPAHFWWFVREVVTDTPAPGVT